MAMMKIDFFEFMYVWFKLQGLKVPLHQKKIARWLSGLWCRGCERQALLMAFRNSGKSTVVGLFCAWVLYRSPSTRILVMAADHSLARKMVRNVKRIIERGSTNGPQTSLRSAGWPSFAIRPCWPRDWAPILQACAPT